MTTPFTPVSSSATIDVTEFSLPNSSTVLTPQTTACKLELWLDLSAMLAGDQYRIRVYEKVNGGTQAVAFEAFPTGVQPGLYRVPVLSVNEGWDATGKLITGTARTVKWSLKEDTGDRNALTISAAAAAAVWAVVSEGAETALGALRLIRSRLLGKGTVQDGDGAYVFRDAADTKNRIVMTRAGTARTTSTADGT